jgi:hypothetical protein
MMMTVMVVVIIGDTVLHSWEVLASILSSDKTLNILCDIGMCVQFFLSDFLLPSTHAHARPTRPPLPYAFAYACARAGR